MHGNYSFNYAGGTILFKPLIELFCTYLVIALECFHNFQALSVAPLCFHVKTILIIQCMKINIWLSTLFHFLFFSLRTVQEKINSLLYVAWKKPYVGQTYKMTKFVNYFEKKLNSSENIFVWWNVFVKWC